VTGIFSKIRDALSVTETIIVPQKRVRPKSNCASCFYWCSPDALTQKVLPSARAIAWAKDNDFGRCTHQQRGGIDNSDKKRFTKADAGCDLWAPQAASAAPAGPTRGQAAVAAAKKL
jgi:hypothetical protein